MHGYVDDARKAELYGRAWVNLTASASEGWSLTVMEAALCGTPSVALAVGGLTESIVDGETGFLAQDDRELVTRAREVVEDPELRERLGETAERRARTFTWDRSAATFLEVLRRTGGMAPEAAPRDAHRAGRRATARSRRPGAGSRGSDSRPARRRGLAQRRPGRAARDAAARVRGPGRIVEIGSFRGRSTIVLRRAAAPGCGGGGDRSARRRRSRPAADQPRRRPRRGRSRGLPRQPAPGRRGRRRAPRAPHVAGGARRGRGARTCCTWTARIATRPARADIERWGERAWRRAGRCSCTTRTTRWA